MLRGDLFQPMCCNLFLLHELRDQASPRRHQLREVVAEWLDLATAEALVARLISLHHLCWQVPHREICRSRQARQIAVTSAVVPGLPEKVEASSACASRLKRPALRRATDDAPGSRH